VRRAAFVFAAVVVAGCTVGPDYKRPAVPTQPAQPDLPADDQADEQDERRVLGGQRALGLHTPAELLVQPLDHVVRNVFHWRFGNW
jgi:hypothetical protein